MNQKYENEPREKSIKTLMSILRLHCEFTSFREIDKTEAIFRFKPDATCLLDHMTQRIVITILIPIPIPIPILSKHTNQSNNDNRATERKTKTNRKYDKYIQWLCLWSRQILVHLKNLSMEMTLFAFPSRSTSIDNSMKPTNNIFKSNS